MAKRSGGGRTTADERLERILYLLPAAAREGGRGLEELARELDCGVDDVLRDLERVTARAFYHPAGGADTLQITIDGDRVRVWSAGEFRRPVKLLAGEALALSLGLRTLARESGEERREELLALARRLEASLASAEVGDALSGFALDDGLGADGGVRPLLRDAAREQRRVRIRYVKPTAERPGERVVCPYALVFATGVWYLIAHCTRAEDVRVFRLDRIASAEFDEGRFEVPDGFDAERYVTDEGRLFHAEEEVEVLVRYSARIARWIEERGPVEQQEDGSVVVRHRVADPAWIIRHVFEHAPEAEVLAPGHIRALVRNAAGSFSAQTVGGAG